ncbi:MAG: cell envelope biogenesis protein TolA [Rhodobacterales bacterium]|nr:cell envelope biogenesis protein TolA [Rhodobacterales bacterium]
MPAPTPAPEPVPEPEPTPEPPPSDAPQAEEEQAIESESTEIQPAPEAEAIIAPDPVQPESDATTSDTPEPAVSDQPSDAPVEELPPTEATAPEDTGDVTQTEANEDQTAETGMTTSIRPKSRPDRPAPAPEPEVAADTPTEEPQESTQLTVQPVDDAATQDAIDALLGEASEAPVEEASDTGGQDRPQGPPLTGGEMGNISSAISRKWNLGASSTDAMSSMVTVRVSFSADGKPVDFELIESSGPSPTGIDKLYETARRAVNRAYADGGLPLPPEKYDTWRVLDLVFDANGMRAR